jgi:hypothetical protein
MSRYKIIIVILSQVLNFNYNKIFNVKIQNYNCNIKLSAKF